MCGRGQSDEDAGEGRFSTARFSYEAERLSSLNGKADIVEGCESASLNPVGLGEIFHLNKGVHTNTPGAPRNCLRAERSIWV